MQEHPGNFDDCRFQICSPNQYSAARELADWEANLLKEQKKNENAGEAVETKSAEEKAMLDINEDDEEEEEQLDEDSANENLRKSMERGKLSERELNINTMKRETGNPVKFGDNYQLRHVKSGRYLTMSPKEIAKLEKQNMKIYLDEEGNSNSHFTINPKHKIDKSAHPEFQRDCVRGILTRATRALSFLTVAFHVGLWGQKKIQMTNSPSPH